MKIDRLVFKGFRNLLDCKLKTDSRQIILTGENGQGKTNLLELVYILCYGSSFRTQNLKEAIRYSEESFFLSCDFTDVNGLTRNIDITFHDKEKTIRLDGKEIHDRKDLIYCIPCIVFSHDDIEFVRGEPESRRRFFDQTMSMYDPEFFDLLRRYRFVLRQRNAAVKNQESELLDVLDAKLIELGLPLIQERKKVCDAIGSIFPDIYRAVSQENRQIEISYRPSWDFSLSENGIAEKLFNQRETDFRMGTTTSGPHRDRFIITDENGIFVNGASTGQMRLASLVFRSVQAAFFRRKTGVDPLFLVDDVLLELDPQKRARYLECLGNYSQAFFTFLPDEKYFGSYTHDCLKYNVVNGGFYGTSK